jgi:acylphosphatase
MTEENARLHLFVEGRVQGVGFRYYVIEKAKLLQLTGWVRNTYKNEVEVMAEGPRAQLEVFLEQVRQGPAMSVVTHVKIDWLDAQGKFSAFSIAATI